MFKEHDLYVSLGFGCPATDILRDLNLQYWSYPFDWMFGSDIITRAQVIADNFQDFLKFDDLQFDHSNPDDGMDTIYNQKTKIYFNHDFKSGIPLEESYKIVNAKYQRRIRRLIKQIEKSKRVCFLHINPHLSVNYTDDDIIKARQIIQDRFPNVIVDLLYFTLGNNNFEHREITCITNNITKYRFNFNPENPRYPQDVDRELVKKCLKDYTISLRHLTLSNILQKYQIINLHRLYKNLYGYFMAIPHKILSYSMIILHKIILVYKIFRNSLL